MAGALVKAYEGHKFVYLHLLCQGFENIGKSMLLANNYDKYGPMLKPVYHHNLDTLLSELQVVYGRDVLSAEATSELLSLNKFYKQHQLRYGHTYDLTVGSSELSGDNLHRDLLELLSVWNELFSAEGQRRLPTSNS
ncbi:hypothetical protein [Aromatoleum bremense]|uniref:HEPN domain-containing protein n=1 Tax=Aromatoleum bremense TaxID=76115 RepID=A0ABX1NW98_9RHOO|nr:hypothetical protein [Aromatoleum bremense]NMG16299.1 hypothetical protein [Aromatoleum bremense]